MDTPADDSLLTRRTLLSRLRNLDDQESWRTFFDLYWRLLYKVARRSGLDDSGAQEIVQDTVISVARKMPEFRYDPARGTFRQWLLRITRRRIIDHLRRVYRQPPNADLAPESLDEEQEHAAAITDESASAIEVAWNEEWEKFTFDAALARVRAEINPRHFQVFDYCVLKHRRRQLWRSLAGAQRHGCVACGQSCLAMPLFQRASLRA